jgi:DNA topoisomerase-1
MFLIAFKDSRFLGCTKRCGYTHSVPKTGKLTLLDKTCEACGWKLFRLKEEGESQEEDFCLNRRCAEGIKYWKKTGPRNEARAQKKVSADSAAGPEMGNAARNAESPKARSTARNAEKPATGRVSKAPSFAGSRKESK